MALEFKDDFDRYVSDLMVLLLSRAKIKEVRGYCFIVNAFF